MEAVYTFCMHSDEWAFKRSSRGMGKSRWPRAVPFSYRIELVPGGLFWYMGECSLRVLHCLVILSLVVEY